MRRREVVAVALAVALTFALAATALADYTTADGTTVRWDGGDNISVIKDGKVIYSGTGVRDDNGRLAPPKGSVDTPVTPPPYKQDNYGNQNEKTASQGYTNAWGDVAIVNDVGDLIGWGTLYTDGNNKGVVIGADPFTGESNGNHVRDDYATVTWVPTAGPNHPWGGFVCVGCAGGNAPGGYIPSTYFPMQPPGESQPPPPPPPPPVHVGGIVPSTGTAAKRGQAVTLQIATSGPVTRVEVELPAAFKNIDVQYGDGTTEIVRNTHTEASKAGADQWTYRFVLAWTQSRPADGKYVITVRAYGDEGQIDTHEIELTVQGMVNLYSPGG